LGVLAYTLLYGDMLSVSHRGDMARRKRTLCDERFDSWPYICNNSEQVVHTHMCLFQFVNGQTTGWELETADGYV